MTCPSIDITVRTPGNRLIRHPCQRPAGHDGECSSPDGRHWTRLGELMRQRQAQP